MIGKLRREQKQNKRQDNINQVILSIKHLIVESRLESMNVFQLCELLRENGLLIKLLLSKEKTWASAKIDENSLPNDRLFAQAVLLV